MVRMTELNLILLDRDGVINQDSEQFIKHPDEWQPIPDSPSAIAALQENYKVAVCTNQSGVGRDLFDLATLDAIHTKMNDAIVAAGGQPLDIYFCPHLPDAGCPCRKPAPGLLLEAMAAAGATPRETVMVGDSERDLLAARAAGCEPVLVLTGHGVATQDTDTGRETPLSFDSLTAFAQALTV